MIKDLLLGNGLFTYLLINSVISIYLPLILTMILSLISLLSEAIIGGVLIAMKWIDLFTREEKLDPKLLTMIAMVFLESILRLEELMNMISAQIQPGLELLLLEIQQVLTSQFLKNFSMLQWFKREPIMIYWLGLQINLIFHMNQVILEILIQKVTQDILSINT